MALTDIWTEPFSHPTRFAGGWAVIVTFSTTANEAFAVEMVPVQILETTQWYPAEACAVDTFDSVKVGVLTPEMPAPFDSMVAPLYH